MVLLTMTEAIVNAIEYCTKMDDGEWLATQSEVGSSLKAPAVGHPISHAQVINIAKILRCHWKKGEVLRGEGTNLTPTYHLDDMLRGSKVYIKTPKSKPEPTSEYKALMARLRIEEEAKAYERMLHPPSQVESFSQRFPNSSQPQIFTNDIQAKNAEDDDITYADVNRQMALIINILVSIVACSVALWVASSHWTTPKRLGLSMGGSGMVGIAEVVVYIGYLRRLKEAREKGKKKIEIKEIIKTWIIGGSDQPLGEKSLEPVLIQDKQVDFITHRKSTAIG